MHKRGYYKEIHKQPMEQINKTNKINNIIVTNVIGARNALRYPGMNLGSDELGSQMIYLLEGSLKPSTKTMFLRRANEDSLVFRLGRKMSSKNGKNKTNKR